jgi:hypothetical protein
MFFFFHLEAHHLEAHHLEAHLSTNVSLHLEAHLSTNVSHNNANKLRPPLDGGVFLQLQVAGGQLDLQVSDRLEPAQNLGGRVQEGAVGSGRMGLVRHELVEVFEDRAYESEGERQRVSVAGLGRNDTVDFEEKRVGLRDERVESLGNDPATNQGLHIGDEVEDEEDQRVRDWIEAVHFLLRESATDLECV